MFPTKKTQLHVYQGGHETKSLFFQFLGKFHSKLFIQGSNWNVPIETKIQNKSTTCWFSAIQRMFQSTKSQFWRCWKNGMSNKVSQITRKSADISNQGIAGNLARGQGAVSYSVNWAHPSVQWIECIPAATITIESLWLLKSSAVLVTLVLVGFNLLAISIRFELCKTDSH